MRLVSSFKSFTADESGNSAVIFAVGITPMVVLVAATIEFSRLDSQRELLRSAADSAVLELTTSYASKYDEHTAKLKLEQALSRMQASTATTAVDAKLIQKDSRTLCIAARQSLPLVFGKVLGVDTGVVAATSCAMPKGEVEIALVLDNTGSMANADGGVRKIDALKESATALIEIVNPIKTPLTPIFP